MLIPGFADKQGRLFTTSQNVYSMRLKSESWKLHLAIRSPVGRTHGPQISTGGDKCTVR